MVALVVEVARMVEAVPVEEAPTVAVVSRAAAHAEAGVPMAAGTSTSKVGDAPTGVVAPTAALLAEISVEGTPTVAAVILRVAETSTPNAVEALTAALMAEVTQAVEE